MKKILYVILEQWADWELDSATENLRTRLYRLRKTLYFLSAALSACPTTIYKAHRQTMTL